MDCFNAEIIMMKVIEGTATDTEIDLLMEHLLSCPNCYGYFKLLKDFARKKDRENRVIKAPENFEVQVMTKIKSVTIGGTVVKTTSTKIIKRRRDI